MYYNVIAPKSHAGIPLASFLGAAMDANCFTINELVETIRHKFGTHFDFHRLVLRPAAQLGALVVTPPRLTVVKLVGERSSWRTPQTLDELAAFGAANILPADLIDLVCFAALNWDGVTTTAAMTPQTDPRTNFVGYPYLHDGGLNISGEHLPWPAATEYLMRLPAAPR